MCCKRLSIAFIALFIFSFLYGMVVHGYLLKGIYETTPQVWRTPAEMQANFPLWIAFTAAYCLWFVLAFYYLYVEGGIKKGICFGIIWGVFAGIINSMAYLWLPISSELAGYWFLSSLLEGVIGGLIVGLIYCRNKSATV